MNIPGFSAEIALLSAGRGYRQSVNPNAGGSHITLIKAAAISTQQCKLDSTVTVLGDTYDNYVCTTTVSGGGGPGSGPGGGGSEPGGKGGGGGGGGGKGSKPKDPSKDPQADKLSKCKSDCADTYRSNLVKCTTDAITGNNYDPRCSIVAENKSKRCNEGCKIKYG